VKRLFPLIPLFIVSCSVSKQISRAADETVLTNKALVNAHVGLSIFDPSTNKYLYSYQDDKYFVPASNTKLPTCYAAMKYLGDSILGIEYSGNANKMVIRPTGDPTFLHPDFKVQNVAAFLKNVKGDVFIDSPNSDFESLGNGWSWNDYNEYYMAERSIMPMYGNIVRITGQLLKLQVEPSFFKRHISTNPLKSEPGIDSFFAFSAHRALGENDFLVYGNKSRKSNIEIPFKTRTWPGIILYELLTDTFHFASISPCPWTVTNYKKIYSQPTDSMLKIMMHRSDNFFAEQCLIMVSDRLLGYMDDGKIRDSIINTDFKDLPQKPRWADGSGLSRYNLFSPQDFVTILNKMKKEFGMERLKVIMATGGEGTISSYYKADSNYIFGKTGTLSGVVAFSGFMYTKKGKLLIFSTLVNNHQATATDVRRAIEKFLQGVRNKY
jgi:D-alanyl-D-alanine carboxypeptidase/D-alanyl-D-alanine-endopeptidase (penicillin-binding protein 4)